MPDSYASKLANLIELASNVKVFVPTTVEVSVQADTSAWVDKVASRLSEWFGGSTAYPALGCWLSPAAGLVKERVTVVEGFCTESALSDHIVDVVDLCQQMKAELSQESVALEVNNRLYLV